MTFDASELRELAHSFGTVPKMAGQLARIAVRKTAKDVQKDAKLIAPRDPARLPLDPSRKVTGNLRGSIVTSDLRSVGTSGDIVADVEATANYARFQEVGTSRMPPRPFMGPSLDKNSPAFEQAMAEIAERALNG